MNHDYDGIRELDNDLPPWWKYGFILSIIMGIIYFWVYASGTAANAHEEYIAEVTEAKIAQDAYLTKMANSINEENVTLADAKGLLNGKTLFEKKCRTCHGALGEGLSGPNLTDDHWLHGGDLKSVFKTIKYGVTAKGMLAWKEQMSPLEMQEVASYVLSFTAPTHPMPKHRRAK